MIADTSYDGYEDIPRDVMQGYGAIAEEIVEQTKCTAWHGPGPSPTSSCKAGWAAWRLAWPAISGNTTARSALCFISVEPAQADCLLQSAIQAAQPRPPARSIPSWLVWPVAKHRPGLAFSAALRDVS